MLEFESKLVGETKNYSVDFADVLATSETISTKTVTATTYSGTDASPSSIVSGSATSSGSIVSQNITAGTLGVVYQLLYQITTSSSRTLQKAAWLTVVSPLP